MSELSLHISIVAWLRQMAVPGLVYWHTPNGELRNKRTAAKIKAMGCRPGIPDLVFILPDGRTAFLELKMPGGSLSPAQRDFRTAVEALGCPYAMARTIEQAVQIIIGWGCIQERFAAGLRKEGQAA